MISLRQKSFENKSLLLLIPLLSTLGVEGSLEINVGNLIHWLLSQTTELKFCVVPTLNQIARDYKHLLKFSQHRKSIETQYNEFLSRASISQQDQKSPSKPTTGGMFEKYKQI